MSSINCGFDATHLYRATGRSTFKKKDNNMIAIPPPETTLYLDIAAWVIAVSGLYLGMMILKKKGIPALLMFFYRFFIREAAL